MIRAKDLPAVDKKLFGKGPASADPFPVMTVEGNDCKGSVKKKCLAPVWLERFELPCEDPDSVFSFEVMDHDNFGAADFMGCCKIKLATLKDERAHRNWHKLGNTSGEQDEHERGEVELCLRWCHDKARAWLMPNRVREGKSSVPKAMPNELHVYLVRARDLRGHGQRVARQGELCLRWCHVMGTSFKSTQKKKELNPVWLESFSWPVEDDEAMSGLGGARRPDGKWISWVARVGSRRLAVHSRLRRASYPSHFHDVAGFFFEFELFRTASGWSRRVREGCFPKMA